MTEISISKEANSQQFQSQRSHELVWFSHLEKEYQVVDKVDNGFKKLFQWKAEPHKMWDWDNCTVSRAKVLSDGKVRIVIRSKTNRNSDYMGHIPVELRYMLGIDITSISDPYSEPYDLASSKRQKLPVSAKKISHERWACKLDEKYWIWQWAKKDIDIKSSQVYHLNEDIKGFLEEAQSMKSSNSDHITSGINNGIFKVNLDESVEVDDIVPVIYQPAIDSLKNFLREVHCVKLVKPDSSVDVEVSLLFNNEELRQHKYLNEIYSIIRLILYGRTQDVETFKIHITKNKDDKSQKGVTDDNMMNEEDKAQNGNKEINKNNKRNSNNHFIFEGIYSGEYDIEYDTIHLDKPPPPPQKRKIEYYFLDHYHPIVFINTANHAMSQHDNNHDIWKWEYIPWVKKAPIKLGLKSRKDIELRFTSFIRRILKIA
ncbi:MAG TPA: hypothetical protein VHH33_10190 [Nitrososphaeraceae archaeon]|jgi:hypothetical protein|nr:hypothetical protein [Nitrososphaeraceae archaeon]